MTNKLEVWLDVDFVGEMVRVGTLANDRGQVRFTYDATWLKREDAFPIDPDLPLEGAKGTPFFPNTTTGNFGAFLDSSPDRWGQTLMKRREALEAKDHGRAARNLYAWDYLIGVQDATRQGALRFRREGDATFLDNNRFAAPPVTSLSQLAAVAHEITNKNIHDLDALRKWLSVLVAPGASLGGARPKANFTEHDGSVWIAKFPSRDDGYDVGAWEGVVHALADKAGIDVPKAKVIRIGSGHHTFCVKRFDRTDNGRRRFYASAMTVLRKTESEGSSYLDLAHHLQTTGSPTKIKVDLNQLFRRVVFNVAVSNRDDHLRNHGFILTPDGWELSPAFDINPNVNKAEHVLNLDDSDNRPSLDTTLRTAAFYGLAQPEAQAIIKHVAGAVKDWRNEAAKMGMSGAEIAEMSSAFSIADLTPMEIGWTTIRVLACTRR